MTRSDQFPSRFTDHSPIRSIHLNSPFNSRVHSLCVKSKQLEIQTGGIYNQLQSSPLLLPCVNRMLFLLLFCPLAFFFNQNLGDL